MPLDYILVVKENSYHREKKKNKKHQHSFSEG